VLVIKFDASVAKAHQMAKSNPERLADDLIWGVKGENGIAAELGITERHAYYLIAKGIIPTRKLGPKTIIASRSVLRARFGSQQSLPADEDRALTEKGGER
jgi:hypothetical protein